ncbi:MAG TPA: DUF5819 family protein [Actinomycetaceae bacterium]|nr:DUF5819 family protein [Actinomycetaceae bacterium]
MGEVRARSAKSRVVAWLLALLVVVHTFFIALWVAPTNEITRAVGQDTVRSYVTPLFEQNWRIFAPTPRRVAVELDVRAYIVDPATGEGRVTEWLSLVDAEDSLIRYNPFPPRTALAGRRVANHLTNAMSDMNEAQRERIEWNYYDTPVTELRRALLDVEGDSPASSGVVASYMRYDAVAVGLASYAANALWDGDVERVQYRTTRRFVPPFADRAERDIDDANRVAHAYGWRAATSNLEDHEVEQFAPYAELLEEAQ